MNSFESIEIIKYEHMNGYSIGFPNSIGFILSGKDYLFVRLTPKLLCYGGDEFK